MTRALNGPWTRHLHIASLFVLACTLAAATSPAEGADLTPRHIPGKPVRSELWPGLHDDLIIVKFVEGSRVRARDGRLVSLADRDLADANQILTDRPDLATSRLFARAEASLERERLEAQDRSGKEMADLNNYYKVVLARADIEVATALLDELNALPVVEIAYAEPIPEVALLDPAEAALRPRRWLRQILLLCLGDPLLKTFPFEHLAPFQSQGCGALAEWLGLGDRESHLLG